MFDARVKAVLGPTNTGKTHLAITRLLAHSSGIIGFPLRLLARENYDRMVAAKGEKHVALITGEEKIIPPEAKWFACTVEAMPLDRRAEFVAVDEIQLCADPDRGHVFTDRLLNARGMVETMFLGAETIRPLLQRLVPQAEVETRPRLSQLTHAGPQKLTRLPPRSAVVAFSAAEVYAIAEAIRRRRGGCAVVMGRLSPRTRNAQVALYQNREVDFLVATDAIGMGLNMDVDHVAFAALQKFDGHVARILTAQEAAQIAGRAGRGMRDGTFGTTGECPPLPEEMVEKIEGHHFETLQTLAWRNSELDFTSVDALLDSLAAPPPQPGLSKGHDADDHITLSMLAREGEIRALAAGRSRVALLWEACQVPDFRKLADDSHMRLCGRIFRHLAEDGALPDDWVAGQIAQCGNTEGDLDTLMARLANIRVWSYIAARADWTRDAASFQAEARKAEDAVSDALHERLTARFVDRRAAHLIRRLEEVEGEELVSAVTRQGEVVVEGHPVGKVSGFLFHPEAEAETEEQRKLILRAARLALKEEMPRRVAAVETAKDEAFGLTPHHRITWNSHGSVAEIARLRPGPEPSKPQVEVLPSEFLDGAQRERVRARLAKYVEGLIARELAILTTVEAKAEAEGALRGPAYQLRESLGLAPGNTDGTVPPDLRQKLKAIGVRAGRYALFVPEALKPRAMALRAQIWSLIRNIETPALPAPGLVALQLREAAEGEANPPPPAGWPSGFAQAMGWLPAGPVLLRLDVAERIAGELAYLTRRAPAPPPPDLASRLGVKADMLGVALSALGFRLLEPVPLEEGQYGPPTPLRVAQPRPQHHRGPRQGQGPRDGQRHGGPRHGEARRPDGERYQGERRAEHQGGERPPRHEGRPDQRQDGRRHEGPRPQDGRPPRDRERNRDFGNRDFDRRPPREARERPENVLPPLPPLPPPNSPEMIFYGPPIPQEMRRRPVVMEARGPGAPWKGGDKNRGKDGPRPPRGEGPRYPRGEGRPDRPPRRDEDRGPPPAAKPAAPSGPDPDSPFAVLAQLKLRSGT
ncbi:helicase-related protein [Siccirubricoccus phaeus]|uniref:helicase-related protein n=1 Tax=Siccirubricoccus phaeus TaxID=2595053 RepID=UPI0011F322D5|nr:helicase-related protein [Siccirubricoccus phaeus]